MSEAFPAVAEAAATGETAEIFADIRATVGVRVVNLVWRHLAMMDGALPWTWQAVKPLYLAGMPDQAAVRFRQDMSIPVLKGLAGPQLESVDAVLASYDHSNTINLFALGAIVAWLRDEASKEGMPASGSRLPAPDIALPRLASQEDVPPDTWAMVQRLNAFGDRNQIILASMYRHLAHAPGFLARVERALVPVAADGSLDKDIASNRVRAREGARLVAQAINAIRPAQAAAIESSVSAFVDHAIGKMVTICRAIRVARGSV